MKIKEIKDLLDAKVLCGEELLDGEVYSACGCDMMSDVLALLRSRQSSLQDFAILRWFVRLR